MLLVSKFGGSSLSSEIQFKKVKTIIEENGNRRAIVVSALGKRADEDNKITDLLYLLHAHITHGVSYDSLWETIEQRFLIVKKELNLTIPIESYLAELKEQLNQSNLCVDYLVSRGEYFTALLMSEYLDYQFIDAKDVIRFYPNGTVDLETTRQRLLEKLPKDFKFIIPGFYGAYPNGHIKLLSRGGSDITGSIISYCLKATKYENWTDVSGILIADPRIIPNPIAISRLSYEELSELSYMGANVLHEETIYPVRKLNIPIHIKNTNEPHAEGTLICESYEGENELVTGIAGVKDYVSITIYKNHMSTEVGFLRKTMEIFERFQINIEHVPTGIDNVGVIVSGKSVHKCLYDLVETLKVELNADEVIIKDNLSLITVVGHKKLGNIKVTSTIFKALALEAIDISLIAQSPRELNVVIGVRNDDFVRAIQTLYKELVECCLN